MAMQVGSGGGDDEMCDINTTPLIDVMLVLLVMLIITLPVMTHAVKLDMPNANNPPPPPQQQTQPIDLVIDFDGTVIWNGNVVPGTPANLTTLEQYFRSSAQQNPQPEIHLRPDPHANYDIVAKVLAAAQRNHMVKIGFVNYSQFSQ